MPVDKNGFDSLFRRAGEVTLPGFTGTRIMMLPVLIGDPDSLPDFVAHYRKTFEAACKTAEAMPHANTVGYLTVDEKVVQPQATHRRSGAHVDGIFHGGAGGWGGGAGGAWGGHGNGMLTVSTPAGCRAWNQRFEGWPGFEGEADHLMAQALDENATLFESNVLYWVDGLCVHESVPQEKETERTFMRISLPSEGPWFEGYTVNPLGIMPTGPILPYREFLKA